MTARQTVLATIITMNVEFGEPIHTLKLLEAVERDLGGTGNELQELGLLFLVEAANCAPEPLDLRRSLLVVVVIGVALPVVNINVRQTRDEKFKFLLIEDCDEFGGDDFVETCETVST